MVSVEVVQVMPAEATRDDRDVRQERLGRA
jgi:hypothetical protein